MFAFLLQLPQAVLFGGKSLVVTRDRTCNLRLAFVAVAFGSLVALPNFGLLVALPTFGSLVALPTLLPASVKVCQAVVVAVWDPSRLTYHCLSQGGWR
jgi:hypothetical protein